jgi:lysophospholipase L1-like esterase
MEWMLLILIVLLILATPLLYKVAYAKGRNDLLAVFLTSGYDMKIKSFEVQNRFIRKGGIAFIGDSITQDYPIHDHFPGLTVYNRGIGGDTTVGLLNRLKVSVFDLEPKKVVLWIGTNDFGVLNAPVSAVYDRILETIDRIHKRLGHIPIFLLSLSPVNPEVNAITVGLRTNKKILELNHKLSTIANVTYIDLFSLLSDEKGNLKAFLTYDGLHLNGEGYAVLTPLLKHALAKDTDPSS